MADAMLDNLFGLEEQPYSDEDAEWDAFVAAHPHGSVLQTTAWAGLKNRFNWASRRVWMRREGQLVAGAQVLFRAAYFGLVKIAYIPHGPLVNWDDDEQVEVLFNQIDHAVYQNRAGLLKFEPYLWQEAMSPAAWGRLCNRLDCRPESDTVQPPRTIIVDLRPDETDILAQMKQKTRYNIRLAARKEVTVRLGEAADLPAFNTLMQITGRRNAFGVHAPRYYQAAYELFASRNQVGLHLAEYQGRILAGVMVFINGPRAYYLFGGSSDEERQRMPSYAVQWGAMQWARQQGCTSYDLWGVPDLEPEALEAQFQSQTGGLWSVYRFKRGFGGAIRRTVGTTDRVYNRWLYRLYQRRRRRGPVMDASGAPSS